MRLRFFVLLCLVCSVRLLCGAELNRWQWVSGTKTYNDEGTYAPAGSPGLLPRARTPACTWTDRDGMFWMYGGQSGFFDFRVFALSDLWKYDPGSGLWTCVKGTNEFNLPAVFGTKGVPADENTPGARLDAVSWTDADDNLWLFSGNEYDNTSWKFDRASGNWVWMVGSNSESVKYGTYGERRVEDPLNYPGGRSSASCWVDASNALWMFGGTGAGAPNQLGRLNDLWRREVAEGRWTWMHGSSVVGDLGSLGVAGVESPGNCPSARISAATWNDRAGNLWLYGGYGDYATSSLFPSIGVLSDLWVFRPATLNWTCIRFPSPYGLPVFGSLGVPSASNWPGRKRNVITCTDETGNLWMLGGRGTDGSSFMKNDLWKYDIATDIWTWMAGSYSSSVASNYFPGPDCGPGAIRDAACWTDRTGNMYVFGGRGMAHTASVDGYLNDLWKINLTAADLAVTLTPSQPVVEVNDVVNYQVEVRNSGPQDAQNVTLAVCLPSSTTLISATATSGSISTTSETVGLNIGNLSAGTGAQVQITARFETTGEYMMTAKADDTTGDPDELNDSATAVTTVVPRRRDADLQIEKTASVTETTVGEQFDYFINVTNSGPETAYNIVIDDLLPSGVEVVAVSSVGGDVHVSSNSVTVNFETMGIAESVQTRIVARSTVPGDIVNIARVTNAFYDPSPHNNESRVTVRFLDSVLPPDESIPLVSFVSPPAIKCRDSSQSRSCVLKTQLVIGKSELNLAAKTESVVRFYLSGDEILDDGDPAIGYQIIKITRKPRKVKFKRRLSFGQPGSPQYLIVVLDALVPADRLGIYCSGIQ